MATVTNDVRHLTDLGNAQRLVARHGDDLRYCPQWRSWLVWDGKRWAPDATAEVMRRAKDTAVSMLAESARLTHRATLVADDHERERLAGVGKALAGYAIASESRTKLEAMVHLGESELPIPVTLDRLDAEPWLLNVQNGTLDLRMGRLRAHDRGDLITRIASVGYDPSAGDDRWEAFISEKLPDDDIRRYVQKAIGYSITGTGTEGGIFLPYGKTHTGKTTILEAVRAALGSYAVTMDVSTLTGRPPSAGAPRSDLVRLFGARFVVSTEVPAGVRLDEALVKKLTGGDTLAARALYKAEQEASGTFVIWLGSNYRPAVRNDDDAVWQRVRQIPFDEQHVGLRRDSSLKPYLETEARLAVLAWIVEGVAMYRAEGLQPPARVVSLTEDYRSEMNPLTLWIAECCDLDPEASSTYYLLRSSYEEFTHSRERVGSRRFTNSLGEVRGVLYDREHRLWWGIRPHDPA